MADSADPGIVTSGREFTPPLTIGVICDTHIYPYSRRAVPPEVLDLFRRFGVGLILHGGDVNTIDVLSMLRDVAPVIAVQGNNDDAAVREVAPDGLTFTVGRFRFALVHGHGGRSAREIAMKRYAGKVDCVIFGHSHIPLSERVDGTVLFNPGSPTERRWHPHFGIGLIHVKVDSCRPEIILFDRPDDLVAIQPEAD